MYQVDETSLILAIFDLVLIVVLAMVMLKVFLKSSVFKAFGGRGTNGSYSLLGH